MNEMIKIIEKNDENNKEKEKNKEDINKKVKNDEIKQSILIFNNSTINVNIPSDKTIRKTNTMSNNVKSILTPKVNFSKGISEDNIDEKFSLEKKNKRYTSSNIIKNKGKKINENSLLNKTLNISERKRVNYLKDNYSNNSDLDTSNFNEFNTPKKICSSSNIKKKRKKQQKNYSMIIKV